MKQDIPDTQPLDIPPEDKLSKIRRLAQSVPSVYSSAEEVDAYIKQQRENWDNQNAESACKI
jgi:hypothetical protein